MSDLLLEIGTEEIPAKFMPPALAELAKLTKEKLDEHRLAYEKIDTWGTPRRITLYVRGLAESQADLSEEVRGPAVKAAFDAEGNPTKAAMGFAKGQRFNRQRHAQRLLCICAEKSSRHRRCRSFTGDFAAVGIGYPFS